MPDGFAGWAAQRFGKIRRTIQGDAPPKLTGLKYAFLAVVSLTTYSIVGTLPDYSTAPFATVAWVVGIVVFILKAFQSAKLSTGSELWSYVYPSAERWRRFYIFLVVTWLAILASSYLAIFTIGLVRDASIGDTGWNVYALSSPVIIGHVGLYSLAFIGFLSARWLRKGRPALAREFLRGADFATIEAYLEHFKERYPEAIPAAELAGIPYPPGHERMHTAISASTGAGKTTALRGLLTSIRARGDRAIVLDNNSEFLRAFRQPGDIVMSPFDPSSPGWRLSNETRSLHDWDRLASSFVPRGSGSSAEWHAMATAFFGAVGSGLWEVHDGTFSLREFQRVLVAAEARELAPLVSGTTAEVLASDDDHNSRRLQSVRMSFIDALKSWRSIKDGDFSFRRWVSEDSPEWLFLPYSDYEADLARHLLSAWVDIMVISALDRPNGGAPGRTTWIIVDELNSLGEIPALLVGATRLRKAGFAIVVAVQDFAQLRDTYGDNRAETLMNNFSNKLVLRTTDASAAENLSKQLGEREMYEDHTSFAGDGGHTESTNRVMERLVMASEIQNLPDLEGYLKLAGDWPVLPVKVPLGS